VKPIVAGFSHAKPQWREELPTYLKGEQLLSVHIPLTSLRDI
jgi:hypothetical protein